MTDLDTCKPKSKYELNMLMAQAVPQANRGKENFLQQSMLIPSPSRHSKQKVRWKTSEQLLERS